MAFVRYASADVLDFKASSKRIASYGDYRKLADFSFKDYQTSDGYIYARVRAIASKTNRNHDSWPAEELAKAYRTFIGKPIFVDHHNHDPKRARGVVVDAELHIEDAKTSSFDPYYSSADVDPLHLPPTWIELLLEVDAKRFPKLAKAIISGDIDSVSMGADVGYTKCSICDHKAEDPSQFCKHIIAKGAYFDSYDKSGRKISKRAVEHCYKISYFELSWVFDPAEESALALDVKTSKWHNLKDLSRMSVFDWEQEEPGWQGEEIGEAPLGESSAGSPLYNRGGEEQRVFEWRYQQLLKMGYPPEQAELIAKQEYRGPEKGVDTYELQHLIDRGATPEQAYSIVGKRLASVKVAENPVPQHDMMRMPQHVDTLAQEAQCPICGSDMNDGECSLCSYTSPPEGFDNPDLQKAKEVDQQLRGEQPVAEEPLDQQNQVGMPEPTDYESPNAATRMMANYHVGTTNSDGNNLSFRTAATNQPVQRIRTQERPLLPAGRRNSDKPLAIKTLKNPTKPTESHINTKENMPNTKTADGASPQGGTEAQADNRVDVTGVGGVSGDPLSGIDHEDVAKDTGDFVAPHTMTWSDPNGNGDGDSLGQQEPVTSEAFEGAGGNGNSSGNAVGVSSPPGHASSVRTACDNEGCSEEHPCEDCQKHKEAAFRIESNKYIKKRGDKWVIIQKGTGKVLSTHDSEEKAQASFEAMEAHKHGTKTAGPADGELGGPIGDAAGGETVGQGVRPDHPSAPGFPDSEPSRVDLAAGLAEEVAPHTMTWSDGKGDSLGQQDPVTSDLGNLGGPMGQNAPTTALSSFGFAVKAMKLAEIEEKAGVIGNRWERLAELESKSEEYIDAQLEMLNKVKTAATKRQASQHTASRVPSLRGLGNGVTASVVHSSETITTEDSIFY